MINENKFALDAWAILIQDAQVKTETRPIFSLKLRFSLLGKENRRVARFFRIFGRSISNVRKILENLHRSRSNFRSFDEFRWKFLVFLFFSFEMKGRNYERVEKVKSVSPICSSKYFSFFNFLSLSKSFSNVVWSKFSTSICGNVTWTTFEIRKIFYRLSEKKWIKLMTSPWKKSEWIFILTRFGMIT